MTTNLVYIVLAGCREEPSLARIEAFFAQTIGKIMSLTR
jgi:hypothetical protein